MKVAVVIPTIGSQHLEQCLDSVSNQTHKDTVTYLFKDGIDAKIPSYVNNIPNIKQIHLDENVGKGWYGHRVYAACSFLVNADVICYLDEDNFYEPEHVQSLVETISKGNEWAYSLRNIVDKNGEFICTDDCESLGKWPVYFNNEVSPLGTFLGNASGPAGSPTPLALTDSLGVDSLGFSPSANLAVAASGNPASSYALSKFSFHISSPPPTQDRKSVV